MAKSTKQKLKLFYILKILLEETDKHHYITTQEIIEELATYEIQAERKSIYDDINRLQEFGYKINKKNSRVGGGCALVERDFELAELKLLVDAVQASKFITLNKSKELIKKIEGMASKHEGKQLQRQVYVSNRIKASNESIYQNVDYIHKAIQDNKQLLFQYFEWNVDKEMKFRREGNDYKISPFALTFSEENYYLIAYDGVEQKIKHFRVDKMFHIRLSKDKRIGNEVFEQFDIAKYSNQTFGMFGGREETVGIQFSNKLIGVVLDRFGKDISVRKRDADTFSIRVKVSVSNQFYGWLSGLSTGAKIISPEDVIEEYKIYLVDIYEQYKGE